MPQPWQHANDSLHVFDAMANTLDALQCSSRNRAELRRRLGLPRCMVLVSDAQEQHRWDGGEDEYDKHDLWLRAVRDAQSSRARGGGAQQVDRALTSVRS